jgi:hypothetical protein
MAATIFDVEFIRVSRKEPRQVEAAGRQLASLKRWRKRTVRDAEVPVVFISGGAGKAR